MFGGLLLTALAALWVVMSPAMQHLVIANPILRFGLFIAEIGIVFYLSLRLTKMSPAAAAAAFLTFSVLNGLSLSVLAFAYTQASLVQAFVTAAGMFGAMSIYGTVTKRDLTSWGSFFMMGLMGVLLLMVINIFMHSSAINFTIGVVGIFVFLGLTAYDNQKLKVYAHAGGGLQSNLAIIGALRLYLDFVNLFLMLLRFTGGGCRRR